MQKQTDIVTPPLTDLPEDTIKEVETAICSFRPEVTLPELPTIPEPNADGLREAPSDEEIKQYAEFYENVQKYVYEAKYAVGTPHDAKSLIAFILNGIENFIWEEQEWRAVIHATEELNAQKDKIKASSKNGSGDLETPYSNVLELSFPAINFINFVLSKPNGRGVNSARLFSHNIEEYTTLFNHIVLAARIARHDYDEVENAKIRLQTAAAGYWTKTNDEGKVEPHLTDAEMAHYKMVQEAINSGDVTYNEPTSSVDIARECGEEDGVCVCDPSACEKTER